MDHKNDRRFAQTLARGIQVLKAFRPNDGPLGNLELSERTGIPKSTISRLTFTLSALGYLEHLNTFEKYRLGPAAISLGSIANATIPFMENATEIMQSLATDVKALVGLTMRDADRMLITHCWRPFNAPSIWLNVGFRLPLFTTSSGLTFLSSLPEGSDKTLMESYKGKSDFDEVAVSKAVIEGRNNLMTKGFNAASGNWNPTINAVAVPFRSPSFTEPLVFFCGAPSDMISQEQLDKELGPKLAEHVRKLDIV